MDNQTKSKYETWLKEKSLSLSDHKRLEEISNDEEEIISCFKDDLAFGTGGLRGVMGVGTNRMNVYMVRKTTQGLANYINEKYSHPKCVIAYDSRNNSHTFAVEAAKVLGKNKVHVYLFNDVTPTPLLSFAVRYLKCQAGIVITASHNPKQYNGYKVYGEDGAQMNIESANAVLSHIDALRIFKDVKVGDFDTLVYDGYIEFVNEDFYRVYQKSTLAQSLSKEKRNIRIAYTALHGTGFKPVTTTLNADGFNNLDIVVEQRNPDGNFPTAPYPNPEMKEALSLGIENYLLLHTDDILLATDPDADRVGVVVNQKNKAVILTGNEVGILLFDWIYQMRRENNTLPANPLLIKTIVSSDMATIIANDYGVKVKEVLTGFKFIGEQMFLLEQKGELDNYLFGFEESCGYLTNKDVRDKDSINACLLIAEMTNYYKNRRKTLVDRMNELYKKYGNYTTLTLNYELEGEKGKAVIAEAMKRFRERDTSALFGELNAIGDYLHSIIHHIDFEEHVDLPASDVVKYFLSNGDTITFRPSGTEPKLKAYIFAKGDKAVKKYTNLVNSIMEELQNK